MSIQDDPHPLRSLLVFYAVCAVAVAGLVLIAVGIARLT